MTSDSNKVALTTCKCKKSKCLKLYCDCFAAGLYCDEACSCQECFNKTSYDDTVVEARQLIELRNPLAFSPKIDSMEDENQMTILMGKRIKGCTCKKSMCSKKYCECYKANVGCSSECRCQVCENVYGKRNGKPNTLIHSETEVGSIGSEVSLPENHNSHNLTPCTPFRHSEMIGPSRGDFDMVSMNQQSYPNAEFMHQFTPPYKTCIGTSHLTYVTDHPSAYSLSWRGSPVTPIPVFGGPKVYDRNQTPDTQSDSYPLSQYRQGD